MTRCTYIIGDVSKQYISTLMHFIFTTACLLYSEAELILLIVLYNDIFLKTWHNSIIQWVRYISVYIVAHYVKSRIYLFDGKLETNIRMLSVSQSMANRKNFSTICTNKLRNCQCYRLQRWTRFKSSLSYVSVSLTIFTLQALLIPEANIAITSRTRARTQTYHVHS